MMRVVRVAAVVAILSAGCTQVHSVDELPPSEPSTSAEAGSTGWDDVAQQLRSAGLTLTAAGTIEQPFWTHKTTVFTIPGGDLQVYQFASSSDAESAAKEVGRDGGTIGTSSFAWMAPPHFFRSDDVIVIYIGSNRDTLAKLTSVFGAKFAGR